MPGTGSKSPLEASTADFPTKVTGSTFTQSERSFMDSVVKYAEVMGWSAYHTHDSRRSQAGLPDLILRRRPRVVWAELKSERGRLTPAQREWIADLRACGQEAYIWRPSMWKDVERILR
jgi:hypothetical protein